jgi:hypothetical protein
MNTRRRGVDILHDPVWNKDLAFEGHERDRLGLRGLLPVSIQSIEAQVQRVLRELDQESDDIHKNLFLSDLQNRNETLFNRVLVDNVRICKNGKGGRWLCSIKFSNRWKRLRRWCILQLSVKFAKSSGFGLTEQEGCTYPFLMLVN